MSEHPIIVNYDDQRGHFAMSVPCRAGHDSGPLHIVGVDGGQHLHLDTHGAWLTPSEARMLAKALTWWADREHTGQRDMEAATVETYDLLSLLETNNKENN